jgi:DNA-directed RNA polymerase I, II, and III subunit RPABC2
MSDDEYYSETEDNVSETNSEEGEPTDVPIIKPPIIDDDSEPDDADIESDEDDFVNDEEEEEGTLVESDDDTELEEDENEDEDEDEDENIIITKKKVSEKKPKKQKQLMVIDDDEEEDEEYNDNYLEKFDSELVKNYIDEFHPECLSHNYDEISKLSNVVKNSDGIIIDPLHRTIPYLTKYERARILGQRSKQIETGSRPFIKVPENIVDGYIIAELELKEKKMPFIIKRPIPGGGCEYWNLNDLEVIAF